MGHEARRCTRACCGHGLQREKIRQEQASISKDLPIFKPSANDSSAAVHKSTGIIQFQANPTKETTVSLGPLSSQISTSLTDFSLFSPRRTVQRHHVSLPISPTPSSVHCYCLLRSEPYDPYIPRAGSSANPSASGGNSGPNPKTAAIQAQIDDTVGITRDNITRVVERQERLDSLQDKTGRCFFFILFTHGGVAAPICLLS